MNTTVCWIVQQACLHAGIEEFGPQRLRYAVLCDLLAETLAWTRPASGYADTSVRATWPGLITQAWRGGN
jgi:hypothetical protein